MYIAYSILGVIGFSSLVALLFWFAVRQSEKLGVSYQVATQAKDDLDAVIKADESANTADTLSYDEQLRYLKSRGRLLNSQNKPLP